MQILIVDDHAVFRYGLRLMLQQFFKNVEVLEAPSAVEGLEIFENTASVNLVLLDLCLPGVQGRQAIDNFIRARSDVPVVIMSASNAHDDIAMAMDAGVRGYIPKSTEPAAIPHIVHLIFSGERYFPIVTGAAASVRGKASASHQQTDLFPHLAANAGRKVGLTKRQAEVLLGVTEGKSNKQIARDLDIMEGTVKVHVRAVMAKVDAKNRTQLAIATAKLGLLSNPF